jgi:hypothetical protein
VRLINFDGMAILGPGSEWFWTMLQFAALAITFYAIYRQLRAQRSASVFEQMAAWHREFDDVRFTREKLVFLLELEGRDLADGLPRSGASVGNWFERFGYLVAHGHLRSVDVWHDMRPTIGRWWTLMAPYIERSRAIEGFPLLYQWFERLEGEMQRLDIKETGKPFVVSETLGQAIDRLTADLRQEQEAAQGVIPRRAAATPR